MAEEERDKKEIIQVEKLEKKAAPSGKKNPSPSPYPPGTKYGLIKRSNLAKKKDLEKRPVKQPEKLEKKRAPGMPGKKPPVPAPYPPGSDYGLVKRSNLLDR